MGVHFFLICLIHLATSHGFLELDKSGRDKIHICEEMGLGTKLCRSNPIPVIYVYTKFGTKHVTGVSRSHLVL